MSIEEESQLIREMQERPRAELHFRREGFGFDTLEILDRYTEGDPNVEVVMMNDGKVIEVNPDEEEKTILTLSLGGCYGVGIVVELQDGKRYCAITHYDPSNLLSNIRKIDELVGGKNFEETALRKVAVIVRGTGEWVRGEEGKGWKFEPDEQTQGVVEKLELSIQAKLGADIEIVIEPYSEDRKDGAEDENILIIKVPAKGNGVIQRRIDMLPFKNLMTDIAETK